MVRVYRGHKDGVTDLKLLDKFLFSSSFDMTVRTWSVDNGSCVRICQAEAGCASHSDVFFLFVFFWCVWKKFVCVCVCGKRRMRQTEEHPPFFSFFFLETRTRKTHVAALGNQD